jgi:hypothetical protein
MLAREMKAWIRITDLPWHHIDRIEGRQRVYPRIKRKFGLIPAKKLWMDFRAAVGWFGNILGKRCLILENE